MTSIGNYQKLLKLLNRASYSHSTWKVFSDFVEVSAIALSNSVDLINKEKREKRYLEIINNYNKEDQALFPKMFAELTMALEKEVSGDGPTDVLGNLFHELNLHNKWKGQFFTPTHVSEAMGQMVVPDKELIKEKGFIKVAEPCVGSGSMIIGLANALKNKGIDYTSKIVVTATDIDEKCVHMAYIQLSLYGIPAIVIHGNSITMEEWSKWYTPAYMLGGWAWKEQTEGGEEMKTDITKTAIEKIEKALEENKDNKVPVAPIAKYLIEKCENDKMFADRVLMEEKSLSRCFGYVFNEVKKKLEGKNGWIDDNEVYEMAESYWLLNITELKDIKIEESKETPKLKEAKSKEKEIEDKLEKKKEIMKNQQVSLFEMV